MELAEAQYRAGGRRSLGGFRLGNGAGGSPGEVGATVVSLRLSVFRTWRGTSMESVESEMVWRLEVTSEGDAGKEESDSGGAI